MAISALMTDARKEDVIVLDRLPCIYYPIQFRKWGKKVARTLIDSNSEINIITPIYAKQLELQNQHSNIRAQKINSLSIESFGIVIARF